MANIDKQIRMLQELINEVINLPYDDAHSMLNEIVSDAQDALDNLIEDNKDEE